MGEDIRYVRFSEVDLADSFFDGLKKDYAGFDVWFDKKARSGEKAFVQYTGKSISAFLYLKLEEGLVDDVEPPMKNGRRLKVGTFKVDAHNTRLGERFVKKIMDVALAMAVEEIYVTIFPKHEGLIRILKTYGFEDYGKKEDELVLVKTMNRLTGDMLKDYPMITAIGKRKFVLAIYPEYHTRLFPDSILNNEQITREDLIKDVSYTNSIHKIYFCFMRQVADLRRGDVVVIYRTGDGQGPARYRSVVTSVCQVEEVRTKRDFAGLDDFIKYANTYSVFSKEELTKGYCREDFVAIKMTYNMALTKRVNRGYLLDVVGIRQDYWGFFQLSDEQFDMIIKAGAANESVIIN